MAGTTCTPLIVGSAIQPSVSGNFNLRGSLGGNGGTLKFSRAAVTFRSSRGCKLVRHFRQGKSQLRRTGITRCAAPYTTVFGTQSLNIIHIPHYIHIVHMAPIKHFTNSSHYTIDRNSAVIDDSQPNPVVPTQEPVIPTQEAPRSLWSTKSRSLAHHGSQLSL